MARAVEIYSHTDPVEQWKRLALKRLRRGLPAGQHSVRVRITIGFLFLTLAAGSLFGPAGSFVGLVGLLSVLLVQELPRAWLATRALGRTSVVSISVRGSETQIGGAPLTRRAALAVAAVGSVANILVAVAVNEIAGLLPGETTALRAVALAHATWGFAQAIPLLPFRTGSAMAAHLRARGRLVHAAASSALAFGAAAFVVGSLSSPVLLPMVLLVCASSLATFVTTVGDTSDKYRGALAFATLAEARLNAGDPRGATQLAERALDFALTSPVRERLWKLVAWASIARHDPVRTHQAIGELPDHVIDVHLVSAYLSTCNRTNEAIALLERARSLGQRSPETTKLLIDLLVRRGSRRHALAAAHSDRDLLSEEDLRKIDATLGADPCDDPAILRA